MQLSWLINERREEAIDMLAKRTEKSKCSTHFKYAIVLFKEEEGSSSKASAAATFSLFLSVLLVVSK